MGTYCYPFKEREKRISIVIAVVEKTINIRLYSRKEANKIGIKRRLTATVGENIIVTTKIRNNYIAIQSFIFPILR